MKQPLKKEKKSTTRKTATRGKINSHKERSHPKFGTSKLEDDFARDFLDVLGIRYVRQFEAKDIGRFYDFCAFTKTGSPVIIEIDGSYYHSDPRLVKEEDMNPMQKRNKRVDRLKDEWALTRGIPIYRIWEIDIRKSPSVVMDELSDIFHTENERSLIIERKNKRHHNRIK